MDKVSIIVPVYKVEKYLDKCVESIVNQTYPNLEIILIDDGSPDLCPTICDAWAKKDDRIKVIHKENGGVSSARNCGLQIATGDFVQFIDSDDYILPNYVEELIEDISQSTDMCIGGMTLVIGDENKPITAEGANINFETCDIQTFMKLLDKKLLASGCNKLYRRSKIEKLFDEKIPYGEDFIFNLEFFHSVREINVVDNPGYMYVCNNTSASFKKRDNMFDIQIKSVETLANLLDVRFNTHCHTYFYELLIDNFIVVLTHSTKQSVRIAMKNLSSTKYYKELMGEFKPKALKYKIKKFLLRFKMYRTIRIIGWLRSIFFK